MGFDVITTMALEGRAFRHLPLHIQRLEDAAAHFGFPFEMQALELTLQHVRDTHPSGRWRVRIALSPEGLWGSQVQSCAATASLTYLQLAHAPMSDTHSEFVRFKTSHRTPYERFAPPAHCFDTVLWNEAGEITECTRGNVAALLEGQWRTPALSCGLLNGVGRQIALAEGWERESVIRVVDVPQVQQWAFINSLRGWLSAQLLPVAAGTLAEE